MKCTKSTSTPLISMNGNTIEEGTPADFKRCVLNTATPHPKVGDRYTWLLQGMRLLMQVEGFFDTGEGWDMIRLVPRSRQGSVNYSLVRFKEQEDNGIIVRGWRLP